MITIEELKTKIDRKSRLLGIDMGAKKIGISICDDKRLIATPCKTIDFTSINNLIIEIKILIEENNIKGLIVGDPINMDASRGRSSQSIRDKCMVISKNIKTPIILWDERLSTAGVFNISKQLDVNISKRSKKIDENAAAFILQGAIDYLNN